MISSFDRNNPNQLDIYKLVGAYEEDGLKTKYKNMVGNTYFIAVCDVGHCMYLEQFSMEGDEIISDKIWHTSVVLDVYSSSETENLVTVHTYNSIYKFEKIGVYSKDDKQ